MSKNIVQQTFWDGDEEVKPKKSPDVEAASKKFRELAEPVMVRIAPDKLVWTPKNGQQPPTYTLCRWVEKKNEGGFVPIPLGGKYIRLSISLCTELGFRDLDRGRKYETLKRLNRAGYIEMHHVSPGCWLLELDSWFRHLAACADDPDFWDEDGDERRHYLEANGMGGWKRKE